MSTMTAALLISSVFAAEPTALKWEKDYGVALRAAQQSNRPLLILLENADEPGSRIEQVRYTKNTIQNDLLSNYTLCRIDVSTDYGKKVAEAFKVTSVPYTVITNKGASRIIYKRAGQFSTEQWVSTLVSNSRVSSASSALNRGIYSRSRVCRT